MREIISTSNFKGSAFRRFRQWSLKVRKTSVFFDSIYKFEKFANAQIVRLNGRKLLNIKIICKNTTRKVK